VRDLAWVLASPPLLEPKGQSTEKIQWLDSAWATEAYAVSTEWLAGLDQNPAPLLAVLNENNDRRLGSYFENLLAFWLAWPGNPRYRLIAHGLAVRNEHRTLGELDFLVEKLGSGELQHWEVAVKFYLGIGAGGAHKNWIGPGQRDRLDLKVSHLLGHQLALTETPAGAQLMHERGVYSPAKICLLKGRLFYPPGVQQSVWAPVNASPEHPRGWWMSHADFLTHYKNSELRWIALPKTHWLTPVTSNNPPVSNSSSNNALNALISDAQSAPAFIEHLQQSADNRAIAVVAVVVTPQNDFQEVTRGFITPPGWPFETPKQE
jgi:hypothetical protein